MPHTIEYYGTLGPACCEETVLYEMFRAGMTGMRLNLSHKPLAAGAEWISRMRKAAKQAGVKPRLLIDLQGPELRVGEFQEELALAEDTRLELAALKLPSAVLPCLKPGQQILLDDGKLLAEVLDERYVHILRGGFLKSRKSIALPGLTIPSPALTQADRENLKEAVSFGVTGVMQPFVRGPEDLLVLREALKEAGAEKVRIYAKLESREGIAMLPRLLPCADEIVIARGDLGNCMDLWQLPGVQKRVAAVCRKAGKPFMVVTQMLASMEHTAVPTRAEVSDIFNAVLDGASSVMVTGETAAGEYPVETMTYLVRTGREALQYMEEEHVKEEAVKEEAVKEKRRKEDGTE